MLGARAGGRTASSRRQSLLVALVVLGIGFGWAFATPAAGAAAAEGGVALFDDDDGRALFTGAAALAPGRSVSACVLVGAAAARPGDVVTFAATDVSGPLAPFVTVTLEAGTGGRFGDCSGFAGAVLWSGTLTDLAGASAGDGLPTGWQPDVDPARSFRVTVALDPEFDQQGLTAGADLSWRLFRDIVDPPTPQPTPQPTTPQPTTPQPGPSDPTASPGPSPTAGPSPGPTASPTPGPAPTGGPRGRPDAPAQQPDVVLGGALDVLRDVAWRASQAAVAVVREPQYPILAITLALLFLGVQDLIDRRDPKLAAASVTRRDAEEVFPDLLAPGGGHR